MTHIEAHIARVQEWAEARGIYETDNPMFQFWKALEEVAELGMAIEKGDVDGIKDAIGDIRVCLINYCKIQGCQFECDFPVFDMPLSEMLKSIIMSMSVKPISAVTINHFLISIADCLSLSISECDDMAWNEIKDRKGRMVGR